MKEVNEEMKAGQKAIIGQVEARVDLLESNIMNEKTVMVKIAGVQEVVKQEMYSPVEVVAPVKFEFPRRRKSETKWARFAICDELLEIWEIFHE